MSAEALKPKINLFTLVTIPVVGGNIYNEDYL